MTGDQLTVSLGRPDEDTHELVAIGNTSNRGIEYRGGMSQGRETYEVAVLVSVVGSNMETHEDLLTRAYDLAEDVVTSVLGWRETDYAGTCDIITEGTSSDDLADDETSREASVTLSFLVTASI